MQSQNVIVSFLTHASSTQQVAWKSVLIFLSNLVERKLTGFHSDIHCVQKKTPTYVFDYNSDVSWSIFIIFVPVEREMNTLQFIYLQSWWRHNCVTLHATKFTSYVLTLNILRFELSLKIKSWSKNCENVKDFLPPEDWQKICTKK